MDECLMVDFDKVCRICMKFDKTFLSINSFKIIDMIIACASVQIWENDDLPNQICHPCFVQLQNTISFKQLCENSDNAFRQIIQKNKFNSSNNETQFEDYNNFNSLLNIKQENIPEDGTSENPLRNVKIGIGQDVSKKPKTNNILGITDKDKGGKKSDTDDEDSELYTCDYCEKPIDEYKTVWGLSQHVHRSHHNIQAMKCDKCELEYYHPLALKRHEELMHTSHLCSICNKTFSNIQKLKMHKRTHNDEPKAYVACHICGKLIVTGHMKNHLVIHEKRETIKCGICSKSFLYQVSLKNHIKFVHENKRGEGKHSCTYCGFKARDPSELREHLKNHSIDRPFACTHCDKTYRRAAHLKGHISLVHLDIRKYQCRFCPQAFRDRKTMTNHERRHTGEKPHVCEVCSKAFIQKSALRTHRKIHN